MGPLSSRSTPQTLRSQGTINGSGGVGVRCGAKLEVLDLYEARKVGLELVAAPQSSAEAVRLVATRIANHFWNPETTPLEQYTKSLAEELVAPIMEGRPFKNYSTGKVEEVRFVDSLPPSGDYGSYELPTGCHLEQIAYFSDETTKLSIVKNSWADLDFFSRGFLVAHEVFYMMNRREGLGTLLGKKVYTSEFTRRFVGLLFATNPLTTKADSLPTDGRLRRCATRGVEERKTYFYAYREAGKKTIFVFKTVLGYASPYQLRSNFIKSSEAPIEAVGIFANEDRTHINARVMKLPGEDATIEFFATDSIKKRSLGEAQGFTCEKL